MGNNICAITSADLVRCWGSSNAYGENNVPSNLGTVRSVSSALGEYGSVCAVTTAGALRCWGDNSERQISAPANLGTVKYALVDQTYGCAITSSDMARCWYDKTWDSRAKFDVPGGLGTVKSIIPGGDGICAITSSDLARCWGLSNLVVPGNLGTVKSIQMGGYYSCAITTSDHLACWGVDDYGQLTGLPPVPEVSVNVRGSVLTASAISEPSWVTKAWSWQRSSNGSNGPWVTLPGLTKGTYTVGKSDRGKYIRACRTYTNSEGSRTSCAQRGPFNDAGV
jgi:hypothetical protein